MTKVTEVKLEGESLILAQSNRPDSCREQLKFVGKLYPRSGCEVCRSGGLFGCIYEMEIPKGVMYWAGDDDFYLFDGSSLGPVFYKRWYSRRKEFPKTMEATKENVVQSVVKPDLDYSKKDEAGYLPDTDMIGQTYFHSKSQRIYRVVGYIWDCDIDQWKVSYKRDGNSGNNTLFSRLPKEFAKRFLKIIP